MNPSTPLPAGARYLGPHDADVHVTLVLRHRSAPQPSAGPQTPLPRADYAERHGADPADIERLRAFGQQHGMREVACHPERRSLHFSGSAQSMHTAFGVQLGQYEMGAGGTCFVGCSQEPALPDASVIAVLGLDQRPVAKPHFRRLVVQQGVEGVAYTPLQLGELYQFPANTDGSGQTIAIIELGGGYTTSDLKAYFSGLGLKEPSVTAVAVDGAKNTPGTDADVEVTLDIEVAGALAPAAKLAVYFAPNTDQGFYNAIAQAAHDATHKPTVMSISWGGPENDWSTQSRNAMQSALQDAVALGLTVIVAAGDNSYTDGETGTIAHVDFPASSPYALACGGTKLVASNPTTITSEVVWNETTSNNGATGGGVSTVFALPSWQASSKVPKTASGFVGRGVPDVAGDADPLTGYLIRADGKQGVIGGTSAVAPLWAALVARLNQALGKNLGDPHAALYQLGEQAFRDITQGSNGLYQAGKGWDACTGLGSPNGTALLAALSALNKGAKAKS